MASNNKQRNKTSVNITPIKRVQKFGTDTFYVEGGALWCKICSVPVDHVRRQTIHLKSKKHNERLNKRKGDDVNDTANKRQCTITGQVQRQTAATASKNILIEDFVQAFMSANIPLEKVDNSTMISFFEKHVKGGGGIPKANTLREVYVSKIYTQQHEALKEKLAQQKVVVIADETTDVVG
jgi:hypothetical protein